MPYKHDTRHRDIGSLARARSRYSMICNRLANTDRPKSKSYAGIELRISREEFIAWFMENDFAGCSVDRIDPKGHYEWGNIQLISLAENIAKDRVKARDGVCQCYSCEETKPLEKFVVDKRRHTGRGTQCKKCDSIRKSRR